jgi:hypothetical protein
MAAMPLRTVLGILNPALDNQLAKPKDFSQVLKSESEDRDMIDI